MTQLDLPDVTEAEAKPVTRGNVGKAIAKTTKVAKPSVNGQARSRETVRIEEITPKRAQAWLEGNVDNRKLRESGVIKLSGILQRGEWELTGDAVVFDDQGVLINGQHRLTAVVVTGIPARLIILRGVPSKTQEVMDQGLQRSLGDQLYRRGVPNSKTVASALAWLYQFEYNEETGNVHYADQSSMRPTYRQLLSRFERSPELVELATGVHKLVYYTKVRPGPTLAIRYRLSQIDAKEAEMFFDHWREGIGLDPDSPIWRLREWCMADARSRSTRGRAPAYRYCAYAFTAWNKWRDGIPVKQLVWHFTPSQRDAWPTPR